MAGSRARLYDLVLDLLEDPGVPLTPGFRNQLDCAALSVSNNIAEGFERSTTHELLSFIAIARGSAGEVRSMMAVVKDCSRLKTLVTHGAIKVILSLFYDIYLVLSGMTLRRAGVRLSSSN